MSRRKLLLVEPPPGQMVGRGCSCLAVRRVRPYSAGPQRIQRTWVQPRPKSPQRFTCCRWMRLASPLYSQSYFVALTLAGGCGGGEPVVGGCALEPTSDSMVGSNLGGARIRPPRPQRKVRRCAWVPGGSPHSRSQPAASPAVASHVIDRPMPSRSGPPYRYTALPHNSPDTLACNRREITPVCDSEGPSGNCHCSASAAPPRGFCPEGLHPVRLQA
jgi:hypothetical protein